jgi:hypothetical protein
MLICLFLFKIIRGNMSSKKDVERKEREKETISKSPNDQISPDSTPEVSLKQQREEQQQSVNRALEQTRDNIRKSADEAKNQIPRYTQAVNDYHEQTIKAAREIADNYIDSQKEIINSLQAAWAPHIQKTSDILYAYCMSPRKVTQMYASMISSFADNTIAVTRLTNNMMFANMDAFKTSIQQAKDNAKELSRVGINAARSFEQTSRDASTLG